MKRPRHIERDGYHVLDWRDDSRLFIDDLWRRWEDKRERFWEQVIRLQPLHVIGENDGVYLLSRDYRLISKLMNAEPQALDLS